MRVTDWPNTDGFVLLVTDTVPKANVLSRVFSTPSPMRTGPSKRFSSGTDRIEPAWVCRALD